MDITPKRVMLVASHGGHWVQLRRLAPAFADHEVCYVSTNPGLTDEIAPAPLIIVPDANLKNKRELFALAGRMFLVVLRKRPQIVVSTGAAPGFFALLFCKLIGAKTIWIDSIANADELSVSGKYIRPFADLWLTQWPHLAGINGPYFKGAVL